MVSVGNKTGGNYQTGPAGLAVSDPGAEGQKNEINLLARIATAAPSSKENGIIQPDVVPVGFDFDGEYLYVGGMNLAKSTKYKNVQKNNKVAIIIDDLKTIEPRGMKIYRTADIVTRQGGYMDETGHSNNQYIRITPYKKWSCGIEEPVFVEGKFNVKKAKRN